MIWSFTAVFLSSFIHINAIYRGYRWQIQVFKPLTFVLLFSWGLKSPVMYLPDYFILAGLIAAVIGGALTILPQNQWLYAFAAMFLGSLMYTLYLSRELTISGQWKVALALLVIGTLALTSIWNQLEELRWPACLLLIMNMFMCWLAVMRYQFFMDSGSLYLVIGATSLLISNIVWLISRFRRRFAYDFVIYEALFILGHFMVASSLAAHIS